MPALVADQMRPDAACTNAYNDCAIKSMVSVIRFDITFSLYTFSQAPLRSQRRRKFIHDLAGVATIPHDMDSCNETPSLSMTTSVANDDYATTKATCILGPRVCL